MFTDASVGPDDVAVGLAAGKRDGAAAGERTLTIGPRDGESPRETMRRVVAEVEATGAACAALFVYGRVEAAGMVEAVEWLAGETQAPVTWVECAAVRESAPLAGVQAVCWRGGELQRVRVGGRVVGSVVEDGRARHCWLGGIRPQVLSLPRAAQVQQLLSVAELALDLAGFELRDVVRTWYYNDDILAWYGDFNRARTMIYRVVQWRSGSLPASTGIGARNRAGAALEVAFRAWRPAGEPAGVVTPREIASPLQCPAPAYGSSFSRAMEVHSGGARWLSVSGTASIHPDGKTAWVGDVRRQVDLTMEVVAAILASRGMGWRDVVRATAYWRDGAAAPMFREWQEAQGQGALPVVHTASVVCRDDLLFEIEVDAMA